MNIKDEILEMSSDTFYRYFLAGKETFEVLDINDTLLLIHQVKLRLDNKESSSVSEKQLLEIEKENIEHLLNSIALAESEVNLFKNITLGVLSGQSFFEQREMLK